MTHIQDPKNPVALRKLFGTLDQETRILHFLNALTLHAPLFEEVSFKKLLSIKTSPFPGGTDAVAREVSGHITYRLEDCHGDLRTIQLFFPHLAACEKEAFFHAAGAYREDFEENSDPHPIAVYIFTPFAIHEGFHKLPINDCEYMHNTDDSHEWLGNIWFRVIQLSKIDYAPHELTYIQDYWLYLLRNFDQPDIEEVLANGEETVLGAYEDLLTENWSEDELSAYGKAQKIIALRQKATPPALEIARREGYRKGVEKARKDNRCSDDSLPSLSAMCQIESGNRDIEDIAESTGIAPHQVRDLMGQVDRNNLLDSLHRRVKALKAG